MLTLRPTRQRGSAEEQLASAVEALADFAAQTSDPDAPLPSEATVALDRVMENTLAVMTAGAATTHHQALAAAWQPHRGPVPILGTHFSASVETAAWLGGVSAVSMEMNEGHRRAGGHPAAQCFPAVLALGVARGISGALLRRALLIAYEVTARVGAAVSLEPDVHPHGTNGAAGAAAGCAVLLGLGHRQISHAILAGLSMPLSTSWSPVLQGGTVRDQWVGAANLNGLAAARLASSGLTPGVPPGLGGLGALDHHTLVSELDEQWYITGNYFKRHSACAYLHGPVDATLALRPAIRAYGEIEDIAVEVEGAAVELTDSTFDTRHGAWFSVPFAIAAALTYGDLSYPRSDPHSWTPELRTLARRVHVKKGKDLPHTAAKSRPARVTVTMPDGAGCTESVPHPYGDQELTPFSQDQWDSITGSLLAGSRTAASIPQLREAVDALEDAPSCGHLTDLLTTPNTLD